MFVEVRDNQFEHKLSLKHMFYIQKAGSILLCILLLQQPGLLNITKSVKTFEAHAETCMLRDL
jgi:hypothetical protein